MGAISIANKLTAEQNLMMDSCIRRYRFVNLQGIRDELNETGITISKSALHRYVQKLQRLDGLHQGTADDTVVVVIKRSTGSVISLTTTASMTSIVALIEGIPAAR